LLRLWCKNRLAIAAFCGAVVAVLFAMTARASDFNTPFPATLSLSRTNNNSTIVYRGQTNFQYVLYASSNSMVWTPFLTNLCTSTAMSLTETNRPIRLYKAVSLKTPLFYQCTFSGNENGQFMLFVRANDTAALMGFNSALQQGAFANSLAIGTNNQFCGTVLPDRTGCLLFTSNSISGSLSNGATRTATVTGTLKANNGPFQSSAGIYSGTLTSGCGGTVKAMLTPDGTLFIYAIYDTGTTDGGVGSVLAGNTFSSIPTARGAHYTGALSPSQLLMQGTIDHACDEQTIGSFRITRAEKLF
jgi:hypothetical protein